MTYAAPTPKRASARSPRSDERTVARLKPAWVVDLDTGARAGSDAAGGRRRDVHLHRLVEGDGARCRHRRVLWRYDPRVIGGKAVHACCDVVNRGVAVWKGRVFVGTIDDRLIALDARTGKPLWAVVTADQKQAYTITGAPRVFRDKVVIGNSGAELGVRGDVTAYDTATGRKMWRFYTVPRRSLEGARWRSLRRGDEDRRPHPGAGQWWKYGGGGTVWDSIVYDPELNQLLIGVGNGSPWNHQCDRTARATISSSPRSSRSIPIPAATNGIIRRPRAKAGTSPPPSR